MAAAAQTKATTSTDVAEDMQEWDTADAGASLTYTIDAGQIKKNGLIIMKSNRPTVQGH